MEAVVNALKASGPRLLGLQNVVGVGRGFKQVAGQTIGRPTLTVLVTKKVPKARLNSSDIVPKSVDEADTDVIEVGEVIALARTTRYRPAVPGSSVGHYRITAGTFGAVVYDSKTKEPLILSNNHVLANATNGRDGRAKIGDPILQPGKYDGGKDADVIARLHRFIPIDMDIVSPTCAMAAGFERAMNKLIGRFRRNYCLKVYKTGGVNLVDAAVARPVSPGIIGDSIIDLGVPLGVAEAEVGDRVAKSGRTSGTNYGEVKVVQATIRINMGDTGDAVFTDQCVTTFMAQPGDSGSVVLNDRKMVVGLLAAGSDTVSIFARIQNVCDSLGVTFAR